METLRSIRTILLMVFGVPCLLVIAWVVVDVWLNGKAKVHVVAPDDSPLTVSIDGQVQDSLAPRESKVYEIEQGEHTVRLVSEGGEVAHHLTLDSGWQKWVAPAVDQCFAQVDVFDVYYEPKVKKGEYPLPEIKSVHEPEPFKADGQLVVDAKYIEDVLPSESSGAVVVTVPVPCGFVGASDEDLMSWLGYRGYEPSAWDRLNR